MTSSRRPAQAPGVAAPKSAWRSWARRVRRTLDPIVTGAAIADSLERWDPYREASGVLLYLAFAGEPDLAPLLADDTKTFYSTRTDPAEGALTIHRLHPDRLERHAFGYLQPLGDEPPAHPESIDIVLTPGLAFDLLGTRLGFGGGYYDRLLPTLPSTTRRVGVVPAALLAPRLPREEHDVSMTHLASEDGVIRAGVEPASDEGPDV